MTARKIVFLDASTVDAGDIDLSPISDLGTTYEAHPVTGPEETAARIGDADVVLVNKVVIGNDVLKACPDLKLVCLTATGTNNVDLEAAKARGVGVCNVAGYSTPSVTQHTIASLLNLFTGVHRYSAEKSKWSESPIFTRLDYPVREVFGKTLGVVGLGTIGRSVAVAAQALGMRVVGLARAGSPGGGRWERLGHEEFFQSCDAITLHCPLTPETHHLIRAESLSLMKPDAVLVNTGRGDLVDEVALAGALRSGRIAGAALDVLSIEPPPADHPLLSADVPNLIVTPHSAWASVEARRRLVDEVAENIRAFFDGKERNRVA